MTRAILIFLAVAFGFSWTVSEVYFRVLTPSSAGYMLMAAFYMYGPALGAVCAVRFGLRQPLSRLGPLWRWHKYLLLALVLPVGFSLVSVALSAMLPEVTLNTASAEVLAKVLSLLPEEKHAAVSAQMLSMGAWLPLTTLLTIALGAVFGGASINAVVAFGEELGWRGFLQTQLAHMGFWRSSYLVGFIWGLWHLPVILRGHNYPQHPYIGVVMMIILCMLMAPLFSWIKERAGTVLAPTFMHGSLNATGGALVFVSGGNDLIVGPTGLFGLAVLALATVCLWWSRAIANAKLQPQMPYTLTQ